jgi:hypothetical protein
MKIDDPLVGGIGGVLIILMSGIGGVLSNG